VFTARYALSPYIKQTRFVFTGLVQDTALRRINNYANKKSLSITTMDLVTLSRCLCYMFRFIRFIISEQSKIDAIKIQIIFYSPITYFFKLLPDYAFYMNLYMQRKRQKILSKPQSRLKVRFYSSNTRKPRIWKC
jgi:hypothetical protein